MKILLNPDPNPAGGGTPPPVDWTAGFPDDLKATVAAKGWKSPADMGQSYSNVVKLVGNNIEKPKPDWDDKKWGEFYAAAGRPETPDKYELPNDAIKDTPIKLDEGRVKKWRENLHKMGLTAKQAKELWSTYLSDEVSSMKAIEDQHKAEREAGELKLRDEWGQKYEDNVKLAQAGLQKLGPEFEKFVTETALGNHPTFIKLLHSIGTKVGEDNARGGGAPIATHNAGTAVAEINKLSSDKDFWAALNNRDNPGHAGAVERWSELHKVAYGTQPVAPQ